MHQRTWCVRVHKRSSLIFLALETAYDSLAVKPILGDIIRTAVLMDH